MIHETNEYRFTVGDVPNENGITKTSLTLEAWENGTVNLVIMDQGERFASISLNADDIMWLATWIETRAAYEPAIGIISRVELENMLDRALTTAHSVVGYGVLMQVARYLMGYLVIRKKKV